MTTGKRKLFCGLAAKRSEFGPYGEWCAPARIFMNVKRAYREFRDDPPDAPLGSCNSLDAVYKGAETKGDRQNDHL
jgi:hypothetical protein